MLSETKTPNKASKLYLDAAKLFALHHHIRAAASALHSLAALQRSGPLGVKVHIYLGRLLRVFDPIHSAAHFQLAIELLIPLQSSAPFSRNMLMRDYARHINPENATSIGETAKEVGKAMWVVNPRLSALGWCIYGLCAKTDNDKKGEIVAYQKAASAYFSVGMTPDGIDSLVDAGEDADLDEALAQAVFISDFVRINRILALIHHCMSNNTIWLPHRKVLLDLATSFVTLDCKQLDVVLCAWDHVISATENNKRLLDVVDAVRAHLSCS